MIRDNKLKNCLRCFECCIAEEIDISKGIYFCPITKIKKYELNICNIVEVKR